MYEYIHESRPGGESLHIPLVDGAAMRKIEENTVSRTGVTTLVLMENAGKNTAAAVRRVWLENPGLKKIQVVCGLGNNGGDGLVIARHLTLGLPDVSLHILLAADPDRLKGDVLANYRIARSLGIPILLIQESGSLHLAEESLVVDALLGTGTDRPVTGRYREVVEGINSLSRKVVVSVDIPSGINAGTGAPMGCAVRAHYTVTMGLVKCGLVVWPGKEYCGTVECVDIGIPLPGKDIQAHSRESLTTPRHVRANLPRRLPGDHKISAGVVGIVSGSEGMLGAGILSCRGALRGGSGMVVWSLPVRLCSLVKPSLPEVITIPLPGGKGEFFYTAGMVEDVISGLAGRKCSSVVLGPGLGSMAGTVLFVERFIEKSPWRGVLDADALNALALERESFKKKLGGWVATPHPGELARLRGVTFQDVHNDRVAAAREAADFFGCILVLKGPGTVVASPGGSVFVNPTGDSALATAGSGDVLSGLIAALIARGAEPLEAAKCGVFLHGISGELLRKKGMIHPLAGDIAEYIGEAEKVVMRGEYALSVMDGDQPQQITF